MSDSLRHHGLQHARLPCPSLYQSLLKFMFIESMMLSIHHILCQPFLLLPSIFPSISESTLINESTLCVMWAKDWSFSFSISPMNIKGLFPLGLTGLISLQSKGLSRVFSSTTVWKHQFFGNQPAFGPNLTFIHDH